MAKDYRMIVAAMRSAERGKGLISGAEPEHATYPYITISRQAGAGGTTFAKVLAERLNKTDAAARPWRLFGRDLVEQVAAERQIPPHLVRDLEDASRTWLTDIVDSLQITENAPDESTFYHHVRLTILTLARSGRVILVGRGAPFITESVGGGIHLYLVAPLDVRIERMADQLGLDRDAAAQRVREIDEGRESFRKRYWRDRYFGPEAVTLTINTAAGSMEELVETVLPLVRARRDIETAAG